jgi:hypothetical protein
MQRFLNRVTANPAVKSLRFAGATHLRSRALPETLGHCKYTEHLPRIGRARLIRW